MKKLFIAALLLTGFQWARAQEYVIDYQHLVAVSQNAAVRSTAEGTHDQYLGKIYDNINNVNTNVGSVIAAQTMIYEGLSNVNSALKNGLAVKNIAFITVDIIYYLGQAMELGKDDPVLFLFMAQYQNSMGPRITALVNDISGFVLKEGDNMLADYNARDQLLRDVIQQLQIIDGLAYGAWKSMYWARERGLIASLTPFADYVNQDKAYVNQIIQNAKYLKQ